VSFGWFKQVAEGIPGETKLATPQLHRLASCRSRVANIRFKKWQTYSPTVAHALAWRTTAQIAMQSDSRRKSFLLLSVVNMLHIIIISNNSSSSSRTASVV
jgi:hypothetical protein